MDHWITTGGLVGACSLAAFALGVIVGADAIRARLIRQLTEQCREDGLEAFRRTH